ncbi:GNAT family N-acetyltransferase [Streptomyces sp. NPDC006356]
MISKRSLRSIAIPGPVRTILPTRWPGSRKILNLFYRFATSAWGQGFAAEAATEVTAWASRHVPDLPLIARVRPANSPRSAWRPPQSSTPIGRGTVSGSP